MSILFEYTNEMIPVPAIHCSWIPIYIATDTLLIQNLVEIQSN